MHDPKQRSLSGTSAFTLIELLVVIAIMAILAAILFPVFGSARKSAQRSQCSNNMRQLSLAVRLYMDDHHDTFPATSHSGRSRSWIECVQPYLRTRLMYRCPSDTSSNWEAGSGLGLRTSSYATNYYMAPFGRFSIQPSNTHGFTRMSMISNPSQTIYICELGRNNYGDHVHPAWWTFPNSDGAFMNSDEDVAKSIHNGGANYACVDGHVRWMKFEQTFDPARDINLWDPF